MDELFKSNNKDELVFFNGKEWICKEISEDRKSDFLSKFEILNRFSNVLIFYHALKENINDLCIFLQNVVLPNGNYVEYSRANRHTLNMLSTFYSLISFCENNIKDFKEKIAPSIYDKFFSYRLFYCLRNYMTHKGLGITGFESRISSDEFKTEAVLYTNDLINDKGGNAKFKNEIYEMKIDQIGIKKYLEEFNNSIDELIFTIFIENKTQIIDSFKNLSETIDVECFNCSDTFLKERNNHKHGLLKSLNNFINIFSNEVIYLNKIEQNPTINSEIYDVFSILSFIYFGEKGVGVKPIACR